MEFKHGAPKDDNCDRVQLCAQAFCLEEMLGVDIPEAALFYHRLRRREEVVLDESLSQETAHAVSRLQQFIAERVTPLPIYARRCRSCSLLELCYPERLDPSRHSRYRESLFKPANEPS